MITLHTERGKRYTTQHKQSALFNWRVRTDTCDRLDWFAHKLNTKITGKVKAQHHQKHFCMWLGVLIHISFSLILIAQCPASSSSSSAVAFKWCVCIVRWFLVCVSNKYGMRMFECACMCVCKASSQYTANNIIHMCLYTYTCTPHMRKHIYIYLLTNTHSRHWNE